MYKTETFFINLHWGNCEKFIHYKYLQMNTENINESMLLSKYPEMIEYIYKNLETLLEIEQTDNYTYYPYRQAGYSSLNRMYIYIAYDVISIMIEDLNLLPEFDDYKPFYEYITNKCPIIRRWASNPLNDSWEKDVDMKTMKLYKMMEFYQNRFAERVILGRDFTIEEYSKFVMDEDEE